jgi:Gpi18-like mannosyltransferase
MPAAMSVHRPIFAEHTDKPVDRALPGWLQLAALATVSLYLHVRFWWVIPPDMNRYLYPWYDHILVNGPVGAFAEPFSNYTPTYLYLLAMASLGHGLADPLTVIKLLSVVGTGFLALSVANLLKAAGARARGAVLVFLLPTAILNAALLGQCDALWAGCCVFAIAALIRGRTFPMVVWAGVAIAFKAQAIFIAPLVIGGLIGCKAPPWRWAVPAVTYAAFMVPAWLIGWPAADLALVYLHQAQWGDLPGNLPNPWLWGSSFAPQFTPRLHIVGYMAAAAASVAIAVFSAASVRKPKALLALALLSAFALPFLLPKMHERYFFLADVLALALALTNRNFNSIAIAVAVQIVSLSALVSYVSSWTVPALAGSAVAALALWAILSEVIAQGAGWPVGRMLSKI